MEITVDTGIREFSLGGKVSVWFNPSDVAFAERIFEAFKTLEDKQNEYTTRLNNIGEDPEIFSFGREVDAEMRERVNSIFGKDVVTPLIGDCNIYALAGGLPIWANLLTAVLDVMDETVQAEAKKSKQRVEKYTKKYHK